MKNILNLILFTLREAVAKKIFIFFFAISLIGLIVMLLVFIFTNIEAFLQSFPDANGDAVLMKEFITGFELLALPLVGFFGIMIAIFSSSSFIPDMLEKGNIDLLLSKPVSRSQLIWGKFLGVVLFVFLNFAFLLGGIWLIISFKFGYWDFSFLWTIPILTFTFAVLYSLILFFGIITKSSIFGMMIAYLIFLIISPLLSFIKNNYETFIDSEVVQYILIGMYYALPKSDELGGEMTRSILIGSPIDWQPFYTSLLFLAVMLLASMLIFKKKDF